MHRAMYVFIAIEGGQQQDFDRRLLLENGGSGGSAGESWHLQVENCQVRNMLQSKGNGIVAVPAFGYHFHIRLIIQNDDESLSEDGVVIGY